jgi:hypothetical protein
LTRLEVGEGVRVHGSSQLGLFAPCVVKGVALNFLDVDSDVAVVIVIRHVCDPVEPVAVTMHRSALLVQERGVETLIMA